MPAAARQKLWFALAAAAPALTVEGLQASPIVPGVSMITTGPAKGHNAYDEANDQLVPVWIDATTLQTVATAATVYAGGLRVNSGHFTEISEAAGRLQAYRVDGDQLRADFELFRTYTGFAHLCEIICKIPDTFGLSIDFEGTVEIADGKAFARCDQIFSCDLVGAPAANGRGLFSTAESGPFPPALVARFRQLFDNLPPANPPASMPPVTPPPAAPPAPATPPPATPPPAPTAPEGLTPEQTKAIHDSVTAAVTPAVEAALTPIRTELTGLTQRLATLEASEAAEDGTPTAEITPQMSARRKSIVSLHKEVRALSARIGEQGTKLARRFGLEFAARAGANPIEHPAAPEGEGSENRQPHEIPMEEHNSRALSLLRPGQK